jgi:pyruvate,water dikinase
MDCLTCKKNNPVCVGRTAVPGCVSGITRVILDPDDIKQLLDREILVIQMTDPDSVPYMQKASGVITNIGGILCHAAIVCREMNKPCIVATKNATDVIKTNDIVTLCGKNSCIYKGDMTDYL